MALLPANPGQALWIGPGGGKNHYNVGIGQGTSGGQNHTDFDQTLIEDGYTDSNKFRLNAAGNVEFRINASAGRTTTGTAHPRSELRELTASGAKAEWDGRSGEHYARGRCRVTEVTTNRPWVCFAQIHGSEGSPVSSDLIRLQTEGTNGTSTNLKIVSRRSPVNGAAEIVTTLRTGYDVGDWFSWEIRMLNGQLIVKLDGVEVLNVSGMAQIKCYFKAGCYLQDNVEKGADPDDWGAVEYERGSFVTWHSGYPSPTTPVFTGGTDTGGGPGGGDGTPDTQAPTVPTGLTATPEGSAIRLNWNASTDNVGVDHYNIWRFASDGVGGGGGTGGGTGGGAGSYTGGSGGPLTDRTAVSYNNGTKTSTYHIYADDLDWSKSVGLLVYGDGSGEAGLANTASTYLMAGASGLIAVAKEHNMVLVTPRAPGNGCTDGDGVCWYLGSNDGTTRAQKTKWLDDLIKTQVLPLYNIDKTRACIAGFSSGAENTAGIYGPAYAASWMVDGLLLAISYGSSPDQYGITDTYTADFRSRVAVVWDVRGDDETTAVEDSLEGYNWYTAEGFATLERNVIPGGEHDRPGEFGGIVDQYVTEYVRASDSLAGSGGTGGARSTIGKTGAGASETLSSADKLVASPATSSAAGTLAVGHARLWLSASGSTTSRMFVYADSGGAPGAKLATSDQITITQTVETVQEYPFSGLEQIAITADTDYWVAVAWDDPGTPSVTYSRDGLASQRVERSDITYGTFPSPFGTSTGTFAGPIDAWVESVSGATSGGGAPAASNSFGKETDGASSSASSTDKIAASLFTADGGGTLVAGHARVWLSGAGSTGTRVVVFGSSGGGTPSPTTCLAVSDEVTLTATAEAEVDYVFSGANRIDISNGSTYWLGVAWDDPGTPSINFSRDGTANLRVETGTFTYPPTVGSSFGTPTTGLTGPIDVYVDTEQAAVPAGGGFVKIGEALGTTYLDSDVDVITSQTRGVGGIAAPAPGPGVVLIAADSASKLSITTGGTPTQPRVYDGQGHSVPEIEVLADNVIVQNFRIHGGTGEGVYVEGDNVTVQNNSIYGISDDGDGDINAVTWFGDGFRGLYNDIGVDGFLVVGAPNGSHTDAFQTWNTSSKRSSSNVVIQGNRVVGPATSDDRFIHQGVMAQGKGATDGGGGGTGTSTNWLIADNLFEFDCENQAIKLDDIDGAHITRNVFAGEADHVIEITALSTGVVYYDDNDVTGTYGDIGATPVAGPGPGAPEGGSPVVYSYAVSAEDAAGNESNLSGDGSGSAGPPDTEAPTVPTNLVAVGGDKRVTLTWNAATDTQTGVAKYLVLLSGSPVAEVNNPAVVLVGLTNGTLYSFTVKAVDGAGNESSASTAATATPSAQAITGVPFLPGRLDGGGVEVAIAWGADLSADESAWVWTDVTADVRFASGISTALGRNDESSTSNPADMTLVLDNASHDYSLGEISANHPNVRRGTPVRCRINPGDGNGARVVLQGNANGFTPGWDSLNGNIPVVTLSVSGTLRRLSQGSAPLQSAYRRVMEAASTVVAYWPFEEGKNSSFAYPVRGGDPFTFTGGEPNWASDDSFDCSASLPTLSDGYGQADVDAYTNTGASQVRFLLSIPDGGLTDGTVLCHVSMTGTIHRWDITYGINAEGVEALGLYRYNASDGSLNSSDTIAFPVNGNPGRVSLDWTQSGANIIWTLSFTPATETGATSALYARKTLTGRTAGIVSHFEFNPHNAKIDATIGHLTVENAVTSLFTDSDALIAHAGEVGPAGADGRLVRLCRENGVPLQRYGGAPYTLTALDRMGPQLVAPLLDLLYECELAGQGQLWDGRNAGLSFTTRKRRELGTTKLTIDAAAGELAQPFEPVDDDQRDRNKVAVTRLGGATYTHEDVNGPKGTGEIGIYDDAVTVNCSVDDSTVDFARWFVLLGTQEGYRYPSVTVDLAASPQLAPEVLDLIPGERIDVTNLDTTLAGFPDATVSLIVEGIAHEITTRTWRATFRCSPFAPWATGIEGV